jgi:L-threonylcarbamoyladenylate synthase
MRTRRLAVDHAGALAEAARLLTRGFLVAFPTDTLYGVGAHAFLPEAIRRLFEAKNRPYSMGIPVLLAGLEDLDLVTGPLTGAASQLAAAYWPGPLTLVLPRKEGLPDLLSPNRNVAVRIPGHDLCRRLIRAAGGAVAASSANRTGEAPALNAGEAMSALEGAAAAVLDGGPVQHGQASTIIDCTVSPPRLLRQGPISAQALASLLSDVA